MTQTQTESDLVADDSDVIDLTDSALEADHQARPTPTESTDLTLKEAAAAAGVSHSTIVRKRRAGAFPNAYQRDEDSAWMIPESDLTTAGLTVTDEPDSPPPSEGDSPTQPPTMTEGMEVVMTVGEVQGLRERIVELEVENRMLREQESKQAAQIEQWQARVPKPPSAPPIVMSDSEVKQIAAEPAKKRWWRRGRD